jgi:AsmA protein
MARHLRRLIFWTSIAVGALVLLALLAIAALWLFIDPNDYRSQIETRVSAALGRPVHLTGDLSWRLGRQIFIASEGGDIANAPGFGAEPLARWSNIRLGVAARPLFDRRVVIDRIEIDGLQLELQRNAAGEVNWALQLQQGEGDPAAQSVSVRIAGVELRNGAVRYRDAASGADWRATELEFAAQLPEDLSAPDREFREVKVAGLLAGGPVATAGVGVSLQATLIQLSPQRLNVPNFALQWSDATLSGAVMAQLAAEPDVTASFALQAPSLRTLLATAGITPPPMNDAATLGKLELSAGLHFARGAATVDNLAIALDDTRLTGTLSLPSLEPPALRFDLSADQVDMDRYMKPEDAPSEPFELPLGELKSLDAKGVLRIQQASFAGAAAKAVIIDVD